MKRNYVIAAALITAAAALATAMPNAMAAKPVTEDDTPVRGNSNTLKIATGPKGKGYSKLYADLASVCSTQVSMQEVKSEGGLDNLTILSNKKADMAPVQLDTIKDLKDDDAVKALKYVAVLNYNYLHVLTATTGYADPTTVGREWYGAKKDVKVIRITKFSDLKNRTVVVVGSAGIMLASIQKNYLKDYNIRAVVAKTDADAAAMVVKGQAFAMLTVSGAPNGYINGLNSASGLTLIPFDEDLGGVYTTRKIKYPNIGSYGTKALAVPNVLVVRDFKGAKTAQVAKLSQCLNDKLVDLQDGDYEPGWNEVNPAATVDLTKFRN